MRISRLAIIGIPLILLATACSSSQSAAPEWKTGKDVLDSLKEKGFSCEWTGSGEQVTTENPLTGEKSDYPSVRCDGYGIALFESQDVLFNDIRKQANSCEPLTQEDVDAEGSQTPVVLGSTFIVIPDGEFPGSAQPADFVKAFGGEEMTFLDLYAKVCPDVEIPSPNASAAGAAGGDTSELDLQLQAAALAMETYYTLNEEIGRAHV